MPREAPFVPINIPKIPAGIQRPFISWGRDQPQGSWSSRRGTFHPQVWKSSSWQIPFLWKGSFPEEQADFPSGNQRRMEELSNCRSWMPVSAFFPCDILNLVSKRLLRNVFFWHFDIISSLCVEFIIRYYQNKAIQLTPHDFKKKKALGKNGNSCIFVPV